MCKKVYDEAMPTFTNHFTAVLTSGQVLRAMQSPHFFSNIRHLDVKDEYSHDSLTWLDGSPSGPYLIKQCFDALQKIPTLHTIHFDMGSLGFFVERFLTSHPRTLEDTLHPRIVKKPKPFLEPRNKQAKKIYSAEPTGEFYALAHAVGLGLRCIAVSV